MKKTHFGTLIRAASSILLIVILLNFVGRDAQMRAFSSINPLHFTIGLAAYLAALAFWALRWYLFIRASGERTSYGHALLTLLHGLFYSLFLPTLVGTDMGRMVELSHDRHNNRSNAVSTVLLDRFMGLITLVLMAVIALILGSQYITDQSVIGLVLMTLAALVIGWVIFFNRRIMDALFGVIFHLPIIRRLETKIRHLYETLCQLHHKPRLLFAAGNVSLLNSIAETGSVIFAARALGIEIEPVYFFIFMPLIWLIMIVPISVSGLGLREGAFVFFFTQIGVSSADAVALSLLYYSFNVIVALGGGFALFCANLSSINAARNSAARTNQSRAGSMN